MVNSHSNVNCIDRIDQLNFQGKAMRNAESGWANLMDWHRIGLPCPVSRNNNHFRSIQCLLGSTLWQTDTLPHRFRLMDKMEVDPSVLGCTIWLFTASSRLIDDCSPNLNRKNQPVDAATCIISQKLLNWRIDLRVNHCTGPPPIPRWSCQVQATAVCQLFCSLNYI